MRKAAALAGVALTLLEAGLHEEATTIVLALKALLSDVVGPDRPE